MNNELHPVEKGIPKRLKRKIAVAGAILALFGLPAAINLFCIVPFTIFSSTSDTQSYTLMSLLLVFVTTAAGGVIFYHTNRSLNGKPSRPLRLPSALLLMDIFGASLIVGIFVALYQLVPGLIVPVLLFLAAALPFVWTISWFSTDRENPKSSLTWRRGMVAFAGGTSVGLFIAIGLEILVLLLILVLGQNLFASITDNLNTFFRVLGRTRWIVALTNSSFVFIFLYFTLLTPLIEEVAKPLVTLPVLPHLNMQETFWIAAIAGAGFAVVENSLYATLGFSIWMGFLFVRALGSAVQPLGAGLVAQGWWKVLHGEPGAWKTWAQRFGIAVVLHVAWNTASLLAILLGETLIARNILSRVGWPGLVALGTLFIFLILLGITTLWVGCALWHGKTPVFFKEASDEWNAPLNRSMAIWALACLMVILPAGIILSRLWLR